MKIREQRIHPYQLSILGAEAKEKLEVARGLQQQLQRLSRYRVDLLTKEREGTSIFCLRERHFDADLLLTIDDQPLGDGPQLLLVGPSPQSRSWLKQYQNSLCRKSLWATLGLAGSWEQKGLPHFSSQNLQALATFLLQKWREELELDSPKIKGLILCGGRGRRMGQEKGQLMVGGVNQVERMSKVLSPLCSEVYLSLRPDQGQLNQYRNRPQVLDRNENMGPLGGILSALERDRQCWWLVVACDLPFLSTDLLRKLVEKRHPFRIATALYNPEKGWAEPLVALYHPKARQRLWTAWGQGIKCPRKILALSSIEVVKSGLACSQAFFNMNTPQDYDEVLKVLN